MIVGLIGAGGIGTLFGYALAAACDVRVLVRTAAQAGAVAARGGLVLGDAPARPVRIACSPEVLGGCDIVLVALKTYAVREALVAARRAIGDAPLVSLSNGADAVAQSDAVFGRHAIALAPTTEAVASRVPGSAVRVAPGATVAGWAALRAGDDALLSALVAELGRELRVTRAQPIEPYLWAKLVANAAINPVAALAGLSNGAVLERPDLRERAARLARESAGVARALGIALPFSDAVAHVEAIARATAGNRSSMLVDLERGGPTEIDAINGAFVRAAACAGLDAPENAAVGDEVRARREA